MHIRRGHYIGVAPVTTKLTNACVVTADRDRLVRPLMLLDEVLASDPVLRERFRHAVRVSDVSCLGPLAVDARACGVNGLLLAGDAAGFVDPMTGDGLRFAIEGGVLAARAALASFDAPQLPAHRRLSALRRRAFARKQRMNRILRRMVGNSGAVSAGEVAAQLFPGIVRAIIRVAGDVPRTPDPIAVDHP
jgi:flavin-dependent dehydrogenase